MPASDLPLLIEAATAAGEISTAYHGPDTRRWDKPGDAGPVTEADLAVNTALAQHLRPARPDYGWLSEENEDDPDRLSRDRVFIVDPIDGTRSFADGSHTWAHAIAVVEDGEVTAAVTYLPRRDLMFTAAQGGGAFLNGTPITASDTQGLAQAEILAARPMLHGEFWKGGQPPPFQTAYRASLAYRMACVARGRFDGMLTLRPSWEWDIAAGALILAEAGAICTDRTGAPLRFNNPTPKLNGVVAANTRLHPQIIAALA